MDLETAINEFLVAGVSEGKSDATTDHYRRQLGKFQWYAEEQGWAEDVAEITAGRIRSFLAYLRTNDSRYGSDHHRANKPINGTTLRVYYLNVSALFSWLNREGVVEDNPVEMVKAPPRERKVVDALTAEQVSRLLESCGDHWEGIRDRAMLYVLVDTGLRLGELAGLELADLDLDHGLLIVDGKTGERRARFSDITAQALEAYLKGRGRKPGALWQSRNGNRLAKGGIQAVFKRLWDYTGIHVYCHKMRHTFATLFLKNGGNSLLLQRLLGHSSLGMTERYIRSTQMDDALESHRRFSPVANL